MAWCLGTSATGSLTFVRSVVQKGQTKYRHFITMVILRRSKVRRQGSVLLNRLVFANFYKRGTDELLNLIRRDSEGSDPGLYEDAAIFACTD
jgi:hypothetical protein